MSRDWKDFDFHGGGLQTANLRLARLLKRRPVAYALAALFPLGLHRDYLDDRRGAWIYRTVTAAAVIALLSGQPLIAAILAAGAAVGALYDVARMEDRIARLNKDLRMRVYMSQTAGAPPRFRERIPDAAGDDEPPAPSGAPSFAEQERRLRELARNRKNEVR